MEEIWKQLPFYDGRYYVSNQGRVKRISDGTEHVYVTRLDRLGYVKVNLPGVNAGKPKGFTVHRLVALMFVPNPYQYKEINHIDGNKQNNVPENLEWCTRSHNVKHAFDTGLKVNKKGGDHPHAKSFYQFDLKGNLITRWRSVTECAEFLSFLGYGDKETIRGDIGAALSGRYKTTCGFIFSENPVVDYKKHRPLEEKKKAIVGYNPKTNETIRFDSFQETKHYQLPNGSYLIPTIVCKCCKGKRKKHGGFIWKYES